MSQNDNKANAANTTIDVLKQEVVLSHAAKSNVETVFAYQMRDQIAVRGAVAVQKEFPAWFQQYIIGKIEQEAKAIRDRIEQKKHNMVYELQRKFGYTLEQATKQVFGEPLVQQPATNVTKAA